MIRVSGRPRAHEPKLQVVMHTAFAWTVPEATPGLSALICQPCWKSEAWLLETCTVPVIVKPPPRAIAPAGQGAAK